MPDDKITYESIEVHALCWATAQQVLQTEGPEPFMRLRPWFMDALREADHRASKWSTIADYNLEEVEPLWRAFLAVDGEEWSVTIARSVALWEDAGDEGWEWTRGRNEGWGHT